MKENPSKLKTSKIREVKIIAAMDIITICPKCGGELGIWSGENETLCIFCDHKVFEKENTIH
jgi:ssDNA-binding Zn-finger/Zn-ribbon topoisomerase 1